MTRTPVRLPIRIKVPRPIRCPSTTISTVRSCSGSNGNRKFGASCFTWLAGSSKRLISNRTCSDRLSVSASASHEPAHASVGMLHAQDEVAPCIGYVAAVALRVKRHPRNKPLADDSDHVIARLAGSVDQHDVI